MYTGLSRVLGTPQDYSTTIQDARNFDRKPDIAIPVKETFEGRARLGSDVIDGINADDLGDCLNNSLDLGKKPQHHQDNLRKLSQSEKPTINPNDEDADYVPVNCLNTYVQDWVIKVKLAKKYDMRNWSNPRGSGCLLNVDLMDKSRQMIQATFFNDGARKYNDELVEGKTYIMKGGQVKIANKRYTTIANDHCITFDIGCEITESRDNIASAGVIYNFTGFKML